MAIVQICDFGEKNGIQTIRVHGDRPDLEKIIAVCREEDSKFEEEPTLEHIRKGVWTILLKIKIPIRVGGDG